MKAVTQGLTLTLRWNVFSINIIWPALVDPHHLFAWRVRIFLLIHTYLNLCPVGMHKHNQQCINLIEITANTLSGDVVTHMLMAVQRDNLELSVNQAIRRCVLTCNIH